MRLVHAFKAGRAIFRIFILAQTGLEKINAPKSSRRSCGFADARLFSLCFGYSPVLCTRRFRREPKRCGCGGTGRRTRFRFWRQKRGGSSPSTRTSIHLGALARGHAFLIYGLVRAKMCLNVVQECHFACKTFVNLHKAVPTDGRVGLISRSGRQAVRRPQEIKVGTCRLLKRSLKG